MSALKLRRRISGHAAVALCALAPATGGLIIAGCGAASTGAPAGPTTSAAALGHARPAALRRPKQSRRRAHTHSAAADPRARPSTHSAAAGPAPPYAVGERVITFVDHSRRVRFPGQRPEPRPLVTVVRYPALGPRSRVDVRNAMPARRAGPFPLIVFGHGFAVTPAPYARLLQAWARAGYVVAAPIFPLENANAPGGPNEADLVNQPRDMRFVITQMLAAGATANNPLGGMIAPSEIAVSGQSDGGETALAVAYDGSFRDLRVRAAVILSGAQLPGVGAFSFPVPSPPLLATQGTADTINPPDLTYSFFAAAPRPKYLLKLLGAPHLPPYTYEQPQLSIVERVTVAFLDRYLKGAAHGAERMVAAGRVPGRAQLLARP